MRFVAIDFETANRKLTSACEIGLVKVEDGQIIEEKSFLIRPKDNYFERYNTYIHGINAQKVANEPEFDWVYKQLQEDFENYPVIAHNAKFDISVLRNCIELYGLDFPELQYICTHQISLKHLKGHLSHKLSALSKHYQVDLLNHHRALDDARACALIALNMFRESGVETFDQIESQYNVSFGKLKKNGHCLSSSGRQFTLQLEDVDESNFKPNNPFFKKVIVFTGTLHCMKRKIARQKIMRIGGYASSSVNRDTSFSLSNSIDTPEANCSSAFLILVLL